MILALGAARFDLTHKAVVMGILNRTKDSFFDQGAYWDPDAFYRRADELVAEGADVLDVGGVKAGPGPEVDEEEELARVVPAVIGLRARFDVPLSVDTWRATVARAAFAEGAVITRASRSRRQAAPTRRAVSAAASSRTACNRNKHPGGTGRGHRQHHHVAGGQPGRPLTRRAFGLAQ
jgi:dihydropteroate synthase